MNQYIDVHYSLGDTNAKTKAQYQYNRGQILRIYGITKDALPGENGVTYVHFSVRGMNKPISKEAEFFVEYGKPNSECLEVEIPSVLFTQKNPIVAYVYLSSQKTSQTIYKVEIPIIERPVPDGYDLNDEEMDDIERMILELRDATDKAEALSELTVSSETLESEEDASAEVTEQGNVKNIHFGIPKGEAGGYYEPHVGYDGQLTWWPSKDDMPWPDSVNIRGPQGPQGMPGGTAELSTKRVEDGTRVTFMTKVPSHTGEMTTFQSFVVPDGERGDPGIVPVVLNTNGTEINIENSAEHQIQSMKIYGMTTQGATPTIDTPVAPMSLAESESMKIATVNKASSIVIKSQPADFTGPLGSEMTFKVEAEGAGLSYQWQYSHNGGTNWADSFVSTVNQTTDTLTFQLNSWHDGYLVRCIVADVLGNVEYSSSALIKIGELPPIQITSQPAEAYASAGETVEFKVDATGTDLSYKWQWTDNKSGEEYVWNDSTAESSVSKTLLIEAASHRNGYQYRCIITDSNGNQVISEEVMLTVTEEPKAKISNAEISIANGLPGLKVDSNGNYTDLNGQQWIADSIEYDVNTKKYKYIQRIAKKRIQNDVTWQTAGTNVWRFFGNSSILLPDVDLTYVKGFLCTHFKYAESAESKSLFQVSATGNIGFAWDERSVVTTIQDFKDWLTNNEVYMYYVLKTPVETELTDIDLSTLKTFHPNTHILNSEDAFMDIDYVADTKMYLEECSDSIVIANAVVSTKSGEAIVLTDSMDKPIRKLTIYGKTTQNGIPSPSTPIALKTAGSDGSVKVSTKAGPSDKGGNEYIEIIAQPQDITATIGSTAVFDVGAIGNGLTYQWEWLRTDGTYGGNSGLSSAKTSALEVPVTSDRNGQFYRCKITDVNGNTVLSNEALLTVGDTNSIENSVATKTATIATPNGLPGVPVTSGGNYTDANGQQWIADTIKYDADTGKAKYIQRVKQQILDESAGWKKSSNTHVDRYYVTVGQYDKERVPAMLCNIGVITTTNNSMLTVGQLGIDTNRNFSYNFAASGTSTLETFLTHIASNPITIVYPLTFPVETELSAEETAQLAALNTCYPNTVLYNDSSALMKVDYVADTKKYLDNKIDAIPAGPVGPQGAVGPVGPAGPQGAQGLPGFMPIIETMSGDVTKANETTDCAVNKLTLYGRTTQEAIPTIETPEPITNIAENESIVVTSKHKNLFDATLLEGNTATPVVSTDANGNTYVSLTADRAITYCQAARVKLLTTSHPVKVSVSYELVNRSNESNAPYIATNWYKNGTKVSGGAGNIAYPATSKTYVVTPPVEGAELHAIVCINTGSSSTAIGDTCQFKNIMINVDEIEEYAPFVENSASITLPSTLAGVKTSTNGTYTDTNGQQWIADSVEYDASTGVAKYIKRVCYEQLTSTSHNWQKHGTVVGRFYPQTLNHPLMPDVKPLCSHFDGKTAITPALNCVYINDAKTQFCFNTSFETIDEWKAFLDANKVYLAYAMATPIETVVPYVGLSDLHSYYPLTTMYNSVGAHMEVDCISDTKLYVDKVQAGPQGPQGVQGSQGPQGAAGNPGVLPIFENAKGAPIELEGTANHPLNKIVVYGKSTQEFTPYTATPAKILNGSQDGMFSIAVSDNVPQIRITNQNPSDIYDFQGNTMTLKVAATGELLQYQWLYSTDNGTNWLHSTQSGNETSTLSMTHRPYRDGYLFRCRIKDGYGHEVFSNITTVHDATEKPPITIISQPADCYVSNNNPVRRFNFSVEAEGEGLTYQWKVQSKTGTTWSNSTAVGNNTNAFSYSVQDYHDGYKYYCEITDANGNVAESAIAKVIFTDDPYVTTNKTELAIPSTTYMAGIPVASNGNYTDKNGQQWIADTIEYDVSTGKTKYVQRVSNFKFRGNETWQTSATNTEGVLRMVCLMPNFAIPSSASDVGYIMCDRYKTLSANSTYALNKGVSIQSWSVGADTFAAIIFYDSAYNDVESWKQYVTSNTIQCVVALDEPIETELTGVDFSTLKTFYPNSVIYSTSNCNMDVDYVADTKIFVTNTIKEMLGVIENGTY